MGTYHFFGVSYILKGLQLECGKTAFYYSPQQLFLYFDFIKIGKFNHGISLKSKNLLTISCQAFSHNTLDFMIIKLLPNYNTVNNLKGFPQLP